jgi:hypothetical protein
MTIHVVPAGVDPRDHQADSLCSCMPTAMVLVPGSEPGLVLIHRDRIAVSDPGRAAHVYDPLREGTRDLGVW